MGATTPVMALFYNMEAEGEAPGRECGGGCLWKAEKRTDF